MRVVRPNLQEEILMHAVRRIVNVCALVALGFTLAGCVVAPYGYGYGRGHHYNYDRDYNHDRDRDHDRDRNHYYGPR